jgi:hypothetical protein
MSRTETAFVAMVALACGWISVLLGKDEGWDFLNYHWYDAYAFLHGRLWFDIAVAHHASYYNPLPHLPFYWLATHGGSWMAVFYTGALHGLNILPLYWLARAALQTPNDRLAAALALAGLGGSTVISMIGKTSYDNVLSVLILLALALLVARRDALAGEQGPGAAGRVAALACILIGAATGLKAVEGLYAIGAAAVLLLAPGPGGIRAVRTLAGAAGGLAGLAAGGGYWFWTLARCTGNPLFPLANDVFRSPLIAPESFRDMRFVPHDLVSALTFPLRFLFNYQLADDAPFRDLRIPLLYVLTIVALGVALWRPRPGMRPPLAPPTPAGATTLAPAPAPAPAPWVDPAAARILLLFGAGSYGAWLVQFAVYRYIVGFEMLAPLLLLAASDWMALAPRLRLAGLGMVLLLCALVGRYDPGDHGPLGDPYVQVRGLTFPHPEAAMLLMTGFEPMGYLVTTLPPTVPVLRIDGWLAKPDDGSRLTAGMRKRVAKHQGDLFLLSDPHEDAAARRATAAYDLAIDEPACTEVTANLGGPYRFCPLRRLR